MIFGGLNMAQSARLRINLWLENEKGILFGMGRYILLEQLNEHGSLKQAAQALGMSYRAAWGKMKQAEEALGAALIEKHGSNRTGYRLTDMGRQLMNNYKAWLDEVERFALSKASGRLGWDVSAFDE